MVDFPRKRGSLSEGIDIHVCIHGYVWSPLVVSSHNEWGAKLVELSGRIHYYPFVGWLRLARLAISVFDVYTTSEKINETACLGIDLSAILGIALGLHLPLLWR